jgi:hypothetical protein
MPALRHLQNFWYSSLRPVASPLTVAYEGGGVVASRSLEPASHLRLADQGGGLFASRSTISPPAAIAFIFELRHKETKNGRNEGCGTVSSLDQPTSLSGVHPKWLYPNSTQTFSLDIRSNNIYNCHSLSDLRLNRSLTIQKHPKTAQNQSIPIICPSQQVVYLSKSVANWSVSTSSFNPSFSINPSHNHNLRHSNTPPYERRNFFQFRLSQKPPMLHPVLTRPAPPVASPDASITLNCEGESNGQEDRSRCRCEG